MNIKISRILMNAVIYLLLTIIWSVVTLKMNNYESQSGYFEINALMQFKILLPMVVFLGRCLLFNEYRFGRKNPLVFLMFLFLVGWSDFEKLIGAINVGYRLLILADILVWVFLIKETLEAIRGMIGYWVDLPKTNYAMINEIWAKIEKDLIKLGSWLTLLVGLSFFYLVSFFMVDAIFYSYLLLIPLLGCGLFLYGLIHSKIKTWVRHDLALIDSELAEQLDWEMSKDDPDLPRITAWFQYLTLVRNYLNQLQRPVLLLKLFLFYLGYSGLVLCLPYFFGRVIPV